MQSMLRFRIEQVAGALLIALGATVMAGWLLHIPRLVQPLAGQVGMVFNTATAFVLSGVLLTVTSAAARRICACLLLVFALVIGSQDLFGVELGIDHWPIDVWLVDPNPHPGRMAPQTGICFALTGSVMLLLATRRRHWSSALAQLLIFSIGTAGIVGLIGYFLKLELLYSWYNYSSMALHTAAGFTLLAPALWVEWYRWNVLAGVYEAHDDRRLNAIGAGLIVLVAVAAGTAGFALLAQQTERIAREALTTQLNAQREALLSVLQERADDAAALANSAVLRQLLVDLNADPAAIEPRAALREWFDATFDTAKVAASLRLADGSEVARAGVTWTQPELTFQVAAHTQLLWQSTARVRHEATITDARNGRRLGLLLTEMAVPQFASVIARTAQISSTADLRICAANDTRTMHCLPTRLAPLPSVAAPRQHGGVELPMSRALEGESATALFINYRNHHSIGAFGPLGSSGLGVVMQQDTEDTYAPIRGPLQSLLTYLLLLVCGTIALLRWQVAPLVRKITVARAESAANGARVAAIMNSVPDGIITIGDHGDIVAVNPAVNALFGYSGTELVGQNIKALMPPSLHAAHEGGLRNYRQGGERKLIGKGNVEVPARRRDGSEFTMQLALTEMRLAQQRYVVGIVRDVTEQKAAARKLQATHTLLQTTLDNVIDAIVTIDEQGRIGSWNRGAERIFGHGAAAVLTRNFAELLSTGHRSVYENHLREHVGQRAAALQRLELDACRADGTTLPIDLGTSEMWIDGARLFIHVVRDISERREVDRIKGEFVSVVSHELRTPLTSIAGSLGLMAGGAAGELPPNAQRLVAIASQNSERLARLINDILDLEKAEGGKLELNLAVQPLTGFVQQVIESNQPYAARLGVAIRLAPVAMQACVAIDRDRFAQVLTNILSNAAKFSPPGATVTVRITSAADRATIAIEDHGPGIPAAFRSRIFQRFAQADGSDARAKGGTGLGLSIAKTLTTRHGGDISYESSASGTTFFISLPLQQAPADAGHASFKAAASRPS